MMVQNQQLKVLIILVQAAFSVYMFTLLGWVVCGLDFCLVFGCLLLLPWICNSHVCNGLHVHLLLLLLLLLLF